MFCKFLNVCIIIITINIVVIIIIYHKIMTNSIITNEINIMNKSLIAPQNPKNDNAGRNVTKILFMLPRWHFFQSPCLLPHPPLLSNMDATLPFRLESYFFASCFPFPCTRSFKDDAVFGCFCYYYYYAFYCLLL